MREKIRDSLGRPLQDLRISVIDRCNFRCTYCMPAEVFGPDYAFLQEEFLLTFDEIERLAKLFVGMGVKKLGLQVVNHYYVKSCQSLLNGSRSWMA